MVNSLEPEDILMTIGDDDIWLCKLLQKPKVTSLLSDVVEIVWLIKTHQAKPRPSFDIFTEEMSRDKTVLVGNLNVDSILGKAVVNKEFKENQPT